MINYYKIQLTHLLTVICSEIAYDAHVAEGEKSVFEASQSKKVIIETERIQTQGSYLAP